MSKEDVIEIEGIVREAMPNAIFKVEMLSEDKNNTTGSFNTPSGQLILLKRTFRQAGWTTPSGDPAWDKVGREMSPS